MKISQSASLVGLTPAPSRATPRRRSLRPLELPRINDLIRVVTFDATVITLKSGKLVPIFKVFIFQILFDKCRDLVF